MKYSLVISLEDARKIIRAHTRSLPPVRVKLSAAHTRILAEPVTSDKDYPDADRSMMDGYVIRADESPGTFAVVGELPAGAIPSHPLGKGETLRISTGAILPTHGHRVLMQEDCQRTADTISVEKFSANLFIRPMSAEARKGDLVLREGTPISATEMAILAQIGHTHPSVIGLPKILHLATGDELVPPEAIPSLGKIRDTNSSLLHGLLASLGLSMSSSRSADDPDAMKSAIAGDWDLLLISGGASVGDHDHGAAVLKESGFEIHFDKVDLRPGKPLTFAIRGHQIAFVIPGNPVSHFVCFHVAIRLAIELMCGLTPAWDFLDLEIRKNDILTPNPRETFWPASVSIESGKPISTPKRWSTSGDTFSLSGTNALIRVNVVGRNSTLLLDLPHPTA